ncbi:MAG: hypothetical protein HYY13_10600 [Nitrospirae bacterium]|nr:hypothetical protein [Nitrospirota bacterium]
MGKPIRPVRISTLDEKTADIRAVIDSGSFYTIVRQDRLPATRSVFLQTSPLELRAAQGGKLRVTGEIPLVIVLEGKQIRDSALVSPDLVQDMLIGAGTMQKWHIAILNNNGETTVRVGLDMRDPDITEVD